MPGEPPIVIENRKSLTYLSCEAAELEHSLMCEYRPAKTSGRCPGCQRVFFAGYQSVPDPAPNPR